MAIKKVVYAGETLIDLTADTVTPETLGAGVKAYNAAGVLVTGTAEISGTDPNSAKTPTGRGIKKVVCNGQTLLDLSGVTVKPETLGKGKTAHDATGKIITGIANVVVYNTWKKYAADSVYTEGADTKQSSASGQTANISAGTGVIFDSKAGTWTITGYASQALASLYSSKAMVYTGVSGHILTGKKVTDAKTTTTAGYYTEGNFGSGDLQERKQYTSISISGYPGYTFNKNTGKFSTTGSFRYATHEYDYDNYQFLETDPKYLYNVSSDGETLYKDEITVNTSWQYCYWYRYEKYANYTAGTSSTTYTVETYQRTATFSNYTAGAYIEDIRAVEGTYPDNGYQNGYWYIKQ